MCELPVRPDAGLISPGSESGRVERLGSEMAACRICRDQPARNALRLPHEPRPIFRISASARLVIASQAPGIRAHDSGIPFRDPSGIRLRGWMGIDEATFYDAARIAIVPMGFCFPGHDRAKGDLPPRAECRPAWHDRVFAGLPRVETILAVGLHSIRYHVGRLMPERALPRSLTDTVADWRALFERSAPRLLPLPHPSWRNSGWLKQNPWFERELLPVLRGETERLT